MWCGARKKSWSFTGKKLISRELHFQFRNVLTQRPIPINYPSQPDFRTPSWYAGRRQVNTTSGIEGSFNIGNVRCIMLDGRSYRQSQDILHKNTMLGINQKKWLANQIKEWDGISLVCTGSTLIRSKESWDNYCDYKWLMGQGFKRTVVLSGDIHGNKFKEHPGATDIFEITSSGAARPGLGGGEGNFGLLDIEENGINVTLFDKKGPEFNKFIIV